MAVRPVTGTIRDPNGEPLPEFPITFTVKPTQFTEIAHFPQKAAEVTTEPDGTFSVELVQGLRYVVGLAGAFVRSGSAVVYPKGTTFDIVVPEGEGPVSLEAIRASELTPPDDPTLVDFALNHLEATNNPHSVTAHQTGAYTTGEVDGLINDHRPEWGNIDGDLGDQTDLASALDGKADTEIVPTALTDLDTTTTGAELDNIRDTVGDLADVATSGQYGDLSGLPTLGSAAAADTGDFATAAQGQAADSAVQPDGLATALESYETTTQLNSRDTANRDRANHTGTQEIATVAGLGDALASAGGDYFRDMASPGGANTWVTPVQMYGKSADTTIALPGGQLSLMPIRLYTAQTIKRIALNITSASASGEARIGLFAMDLSSAEFGSWTAECLDELGVIGTDGTGQVELGTPGDPLDVEVGPGVIWLGVLGDESFTVSAFLPLLGASQGTSVDGTQRAWAKKNTTYAPLAGNYTGGWNHTATACPQIGVRLDF